MNPAAPYPEGDFGPNASRQAQQFAPPSGAAGMDGARSPQSDLSPPLLQSPQSSGAARGLVSGGYVPYADVYGPPPTQQAQAYPPPPPQSSPGRGHDHDEEQTRLHPVAPPPGHYHQNPYAQEAATAGAAGAGAGYGGQAGFIPAYDQSLDPRYAHRYDERYNGYDEHGRPYSLSSSHDSRDRRRQDYSPSSPSFASDERRRRGDDDRRDSRPSERPDDDPRRTKSHAGRGKSRLRERFDTSQRGMGYGAIGAVAGGLIGNEFGHGLVPTALGAAVGALGANAFEARERYVPNEYVSSPLSATLNDASRPAEAAGCAAAFS